MPLDPYGGRAPPSGTDYVAFNRGYRSTTGWQPPPGRTNRFLMGLLGRGEPPREVYPGTGVPDPRSPEGLGSLLSMLVGKPRFRSERIYHNPHSDPPRETPIPTPYNVSGERTRGEDILHGRLYLWDEANRQPFTTAPPAPGVEPGGPRLAGSLTYMRPNPATGHAGYGGTAYVHPDYRRTSALSRLAQGFLREMGQRPFETHFVNPALSRVAERYLARAGYSVRRQPTVMVGDIAVPGGNEFWPPGYVPTRPSPTPIRRPGQERPWDVPARGPNQAEYDEFMEWYTDFMRRHGPAPPL